MSTEREEKTASSESLYQRDLRKKRTVAVQIDVDVAAAADQHALANIGSAYYVGLPIAAAVAGQIDRCCGRIHRPLDVRVAITREA